LQLIKDSPYVNGIEMCQYGSEIDMLHNAGISMSIHNPLRDHKIGFEDKEFSEYMERDDVLAGCNKCDTGIIGFHAGYNSKGTERDIMLNRCINNIKVAQEKLNDEILFETRPFRREYIKTDPERIYFTSIEFIRKLIEETGCGYLFDVSHVWVSVSTRQTWKGEDAREYIRNILREFGPNIRQMHLNVCKGDWEDGFDDAHKIFKEGESNSELIMDIAKEVIAHAPNLKIITLEMTTGLAPLEHTQELLEQARYLKEKGVIPS
jgi:endonuclease IV